MSKSEICDKFSNPNIAYEIQSPEERLKLDQLAKVRGVINAGISRSSMSRLLMKKTFGVIDAGISGTINSRVARGKK